MSVKFKPTQIAMPLSANYGRWYAKMAPTATVTDFGALSFVTCYIKVVSQCSLYSVIAGPSARFGSRSVNPKLKSLNISKICAEHCFPFRKKLYL